MNLRGWMLIVGLGTIGSLAGCIPSLHPLYTDADLTENPAVIGEWVRADSPETWTVTKTGEKEYLLVHADDNGKKGQFAVHLLKAGDLLFADLYPVEPDLKENDFYKAYLMRVHTFVRVRQTEPTLQVASLDVDWLKKYLQEHPDALKHEKVGDDVLVTAQPKDLQAFLVKQEKTLEAWSDIPPMTRKAANPKP